MLRTLDDQEVRKTTAALEAALIPFTNRFPGSAGERQPVHTVYGGAHLFKADTVQKLGVVAQRTLQEYAPDSETFADALAIWGEETVDAR